METYLFCFVNNNSKVKLLKHLKVHINQLFLAFQLLAPLRSLPLESKDPCLDPNDINCGVILYGPVLKESKNLHFSLSL